MDRTKASACRIKKADIAAFAVFFLLTGCIVFSIYTQLCIEDEVYNAAVIQRFVNGDRLFVDEWGVSQMSHLFSVIPYKIYAVLTGSLEGIIVFLRYNYLIAELPLFWFFYLKLRDFGWGSLIAAMLLCGTPMLGMLILNYYNIAVQGAAVVAVMLFLPAKKPSNIRNIIAGVIFSFATMCEPGFALIYVLYSFLTIVRHMALKRRKKDMLHSYSFILDTKIWFGLTLGISVCFISFMTVLLLHSGADNIRDNLIGFFHNNYYFNSETFDWRIEQRFVALKEAFSLVTVVLMVILAGVAVIFQNKIKESDIAKKALFTATLSLCVVSYMTAVIRSLKDDNTVSYLQLGMFLPLHICTFILYSLCKNKNRRLFAFWIFATACSVAADSVSLGQICYGGKISCIPFIFLVRNLFEELKQGCKDVSAGSVQGQNKSRLFNQITKRLFPAIITLLLVISSMGITFYPYAVGYVYQNRIYSDKTDGFEVIPSGPMKGILAKSSYVRFYEAAAGDLDIIKKNCKGPFFAVSVFPYAYLYLDLPIGIYSPYSPFETPIGESERYLLYWQKHPERKPEYMYFLTGKEDPAYNEYFTESDKNFLSFLGRLCDFELIQGNCGDIIHVTRWY